MKIPIEISIRHVHLSQADLERLFGKKYQLKVLHKISQPNQFAAKEEVKLVNGKNKLKARIIGPVRKQTQIEIAITDAYRLKMKKIPPINLSGNLKNTPQLTIKGPRGTVKGSVIIEQRHLHLSEVEVKKLKLKNNQIIKIKTKGKRAVTFDNIIVRAGKEHKFAFQIDTDEGNAAGLDGRKKNFGILIR